MEAPPCASASCDGPGTEGEGTAAPRAAATVGAEGGDLELAGVRLHVPAGALSRSQEIALTVIEDQAADREVRTYYQFEPDGLTFAEPIEVSFQAEPGLATPVVYWTDDEQKRYVPLITRVKDGRASAYATHFSSAIQVSRPDNGCIDVSAPSSEDASACGRWRCVDPSCSRVTCVETNVLATCRAHRRKSLQSGNGHSCSIGPNGTVRCWGLSAGGAAGDGGPSLTPTPLTVADLTGVVELASSGYFSCALRLSGEVTCWGEVGNRDVGPTRQLQFGDVAEIATSNTDGCVRLLDGTVKCWPTASGSSWILAPVPKLANVVEIGVGDGQACARLTSGAVYCWGSNNDVGQAGVGDFVASPNAPRGRALSDATQLAVGSDVNCAIRTSGTISCWGNARLVHGSPYTRLLGEPRPVNILELPDARTVAVGPDHACVTRATGDVLCWGRNYDGEFGPGPARTEMAPTTSEALRTATDIACDIGTTCARYASGSIQCFGDNGTGQLGNGTATGVSVLGCGDGKVTFPEHCDDGGIVTEACPYGGPACTICSGRCELIPGAIPRCGDGITNGPEACDDGNQVTEVCAPGLATCQVCNASCQLQVVGSSCAVNGGACAAGTGCLTIAGATACTGRLGTIAVGAMHSCALRNDGSVGCWGSNGSGQLGTGDTMPRGSATPIEGTTGAVQLAAGMNTSCATMQNGRVLCWGANEHGQLGDLSTIDRARPVAVAGLDNAVQVSVGDQHACAVRNDGTVACWGGNADGQFEHGASAQPRYPLTNVAGVTDAVEVSVGIMHACARRRTGRVQCWGSGAEGQHGDDVTGDYASIFEPAHEVVQLDDAQQLSAAARGQCARSRSRGVVCWGAQCADNTCGQLETSSIPIEVPGTVDAIALGSGDLSHCILNASGSPSCWGRSPIGGGQPGAPRDSLTPTVFSAVTGAVEVAGGYSHLCARAAWNRVVCWGGFNTDQQLGGPQPTPTSVVTVSGL